MQHPLANLQQDDERYVLANIIHGLHQTGLGHERDIKDLAAQAEQALHASVAHFNLAEAEQRANLQVEEVLQAKAAAEEQMRASQERLAAVEAAERRYSG